MRLLMRELEVEVLTCLDYVHKQARKICSNFCTKFTMGKELLERLAYLFLVSYQLYINLSFFPL